MRQTLLIILFIFAGISFAQIPKGISYQAIVANSLGSIQESRDVAFRISLLEGSSTGSVVYAETHKVKTNDKGVVNLVIGRGTTIDGSFDEIVWQNGRFYAKFEVDLSAGTNFRFMGVTELLTVPFAFYAFRSDSASYAFKADSANISGPYYEVGDTAQGGMVIATWDGGRHGLVSGLKDLTGSISWDRASLLAEADTTGGFKDWRIPTIAQLKMMYKNREKIKGFTSWAYHSSNTISRMLIRNEGAYNETKEYYEWGLVL